MTVQDKPLTVRDRLRGAGLWTGAELTLSPADTMASPSWWGADSESYSLRASEADARAGSAAFVKAMETHARDYVDLPAAFEAASSAGEAGIGPQVHHADTGHAVLVMADLTGLAATATLDLFDEPAEAERLVALRTAVHRLPEFRRRATVFDDIRAVHQLVLGLGGALPADFGWMMRVLGPAEQRIEPARQVGRPLHHPAAAHSVTVTPVCARTCAGSVSAVSG